MSGKKSSKARVWIIIGVIVIIGGMVAVILQNKKKVRGTHVEIAEVQYDSLQQTVAASGKIQPTVDVNISSDVSGRIVRLAVDEGDRVERGQFLVSIEDEYYRSSVQQAEFTLRSVEASLEEARSNLRRVNELHGRDLSSDSELETSQATVTRLEADVDRARATVTQAQDELAKTRMYAPIGGTVTSIRKEEGEIAMGGQFSFDVILVISQLDAMEVNVEVNENDVVLIDPGDDVDIEVYAIPDTTFRGVVTEISHSGIIRGQGSAEEVTNFEVKVAILDRVPDLRPGMSATVEIVTDRRAHTLVVPQEAVAVREMNAERRLEREAKQSATRGRNRRNRNNENEQVHSPGSDNEELKEVVYIVREDSAWVQDVRLGIYSDTHFEILSGVNEGDLIVTGPFRLLSRELHSGTAVEFTPIPEDDTSEGSESESETDEVAASGS